MVQNAGAPYIIEISPNYVVASFMTDEDAQQQAWPAHASVKVQLGYLAASSSQILWNEPVSLDANVYWPGMASLDEKQRRACVSYEYSGKPVLREIKSLY